MQSNDVAVVSALFRKRGDHRLRWWDILHHKVMILPTAKLSASRTVASQRRTFRHKTDELFCATFQLQYSRLTRYSLRDAPYCASAYCSLHLPLAALTTAPFEGRHKKHQICCSFFTFCKANSEFRIPNSEF